MLTYEVTAFPRARSSRMLDEIAASSVAAERDDVAKNVAELGCAVVLVYDAICRGE
jgi:hypothetical protein